MKRKRVIVAKQSVGEEPSWKSKTKPTQGDIAKALNWYNENREEKHAAKFLGVPKTIAKEHTTAAWITRMLTRGFKLPKNSNKSYKEMMKKVKAAHKQRKAEIKKPVETISIQERIRMKTDEIIGEMEGMIDDFGIHGDYKQMSAYQWMVDNEVKSIHCAAIIEHFQAQAAEVYVAATGKDKDLVEGYSNFTKAELVNLLKTYATIVQDAERLAHNASKQRKPRKRKPPSFEKMVSKVNYKERDDSLKIVSLDPIKIIGASQLWVYNTKTRNLGVYNALDEAGLGIKGTTVQNFGYSSIAKILRKPEKVLPDVIKGGKVKLRKVMDSINAKPKKLTGRINKDTILLRVI